MEDNKNRQGKNQKKKKHKHIWMYLYIQLINWGWSQNNRRLERPSALDKECWGLKTNAIHAEGRTVPKNGGGDK